MKFPIPFLAWTGRAALEIEIPDDTKARFRLRTALEIAVKLRADLTSADLRSAYLPGADLTRADLRSAYLPGANLAGADLTRADLRSAYLPGANLAGADLRSAYLLGADLTRADLTRADLRSAYLPGANLAGADLTVIRGDLIAEVLKLPNELMALRAAIIGGKIDGSTYTRDCACLAGTLAKALGDANYEGDDIEINDAVTFHADAGSPREKFFTAIRPGDTPATNPTAAMALQWVDEAIAIRDLIRATATAPEAS